MLSDLYAERERIQAQLQALLIFPNTRTVRQLRRELEAKLKRIEEKIEQLEREEDESALEDEGEEEQEDEDADLSRSKAMKRHNRYIRLIHDNYPEYSYNDIRTMLARRKRGKVVDIPDVVWQNPSP